MVLIIDTIKKLHGFNKLHGFKKIEKWNEYWFFSPTSDQTNNIINKKL